MQDAKHIRRQRLKLLLIFVIFAAPIIAAWGMLELRIGIPDRHTAHGTIDPALPMLNEWPLEQRVGSDSQQDAWTLAFDCSKACEHRKDQLWRLHRALGKDAPRLVRLRIGGDTQPLPGELTSEWEHLPPWREANAVWLLDPVGRPALAFSPHMETKYLLEDIQHLFKVNPQ